MGKHEGYEYNGKQMTLALAYAHGVSGGRRMQRSESGTTM